MRGVPLSGKKRSWSIYHIMTSSLFSSNESLLLCFTRASASQWNCCRHDEKLILEYTASHIHLPQNLSLANPGAIPTSSFLPSSMEVNLKRSFLLGDMQQLVSCYYTCCFSLRDIIVLLKNISNEGVGATDTIGKNLKCSTVHRWAVLFKLYK